MPPQSTAASSLPAPPGHTSKSVLSLILIAVGSVLGIVFITLGAFLLYKRRRRAMRKALKGKKKLTGTGTLPPPGLLGNTDESKLRMQMGLNIPVRAHLDPLPPVAGQNGRGTLKKTVPGGSVPNTPGPSGAGFRWEDEDTQGMRKMMRKLSISSE